ncbi:testis-expressed protein 9 [Chanos chanos]|uniref:Testis-expressed protein 9 n=1 Tax=Chanos chanos TaxID=29144 RepID=A0A6J2X0Q4_CHACN|nr:testis-expressed protein 9 [Chanos chanos]
MADCRPVSASHGVKKLCSLDPERSQGHRPKNRASSAPSKKPSEMDIFAQEEEYKRLNAELEAKTAELVRQAEQVMREQNEVLSKPVTSHISIDIEDDLEDLGKAKPTAVADFALPEDFAGFSLAKTISELEGQVDDVTLEHLEDDVMPSVGNEMSSEAQIRFLKAKLRVMQEEFNRISHECNKKDDENITLSTKLKEAEEDRTRLQRTVNIQQTQMDKHRGLAEESNRKCDGLQQQVTALQKEIDGLKRANKLAANAHSATEVRLNRALEEAEKTKTQLNKIRQSSKDASNQEQQTMELLRAENKKLEKQKAELIMGFKKQLKLIDILKRQKMHFEAAKLLSFTEEEFMKALDWGKS